MASDTDTLRSGAGTAARPATSPLDSRPPARRRRGVLGWAVTAVALVAAAALAVTVLARGDDAETPVAPFDPQVEQSEREAHLEGQAHTYGVDTPAVAVPHSAAADAERYEREAHLEGQADTYGVDGNSAEASSPEASGDEADNDEFVPGSRHMPTR